VPLYSDTEGIINKELPLYPSGAGCGAGLKKSASAYYGAGDENQYPLFLISERKESFLVLLKHA
jgi:hypothetical protein